MPRVDFLITSNRHHAEMFHPVAVALGERGVDRRLISLCELRGLETPEESFAAAGIRVERLWTLGLRRPRASAGGRVAAPSRALRAPVYRAAWHGYLAWKVRRWLRQPPDLVMIPNDAAFPYNFVCRALRRRGIPFVLLQEGIRFAETVFEEEGIVGQGRSGAAAIACWGESSAEFYRRRGAPSESIRLTGNPRFDALAAGDRGRDTDAVAARLPAGEPTLSVLTNPIELWGFCTREQKMELVAGLLAGLGPLFESSRLRVAIKLHPQESVADFRRLAAAHRHGERIAVLGEVPLYPLLRLSDAAVVLASTVGLEALLLGVPLGVLEVPGHGFLHDFVSSGAARGLRPGDGLTREVAGLLAESRRPAVDAYLDRTLASRDNATGEVVAVALELLGRAGALQ